MRGLGLGLLTLGFLYGSYVAVQTPENLVSWSRFVPALVVAAIGVILARVAARSGAQHADVVEDNVRALSSSIAAVVSKITDLDNEKESVDVYDLPERIDRDFPNDLNTFVQARETIGHVFDLQAYADVMNSFAAGERYLNRVWSASVDGYIDEAHTYLGRAREQFEEARTKIDTLLKRQAG